MKYFDDHEVRDPGERERALLSALPDQVAHAKAHAPYFSKLFADVDARRITSRDALARLPVTRKSELHTLQQAAPPFGGLTATVPGALAKIFVSPGSLYDPEGRGKDYWRASRALYA